MTTPAPPRSPTRSRSQASRRVRNSVHSDCPPEPDTEPPGESSPGLGQRSVSLTTLQPTVIRPRMAQLETLEARMASIEVSLSNSSRRKKFNTGVLNSSIRSIPKELASKELDNLRNALKDKENIIQSLRGQLTVPGLRLNSILSGSTGNNNNTTARELTEVEKKQAEDRLGRLKTDIDNKRLAIKNLKMALERLDITDNIDVRIQQAELEYQLGREELNLLTLLEETRALQLCIEESNRSSAENNTLYSCVNGSDYVILKAVTIDYDEKSPNFGAGQRDNLPGLWIDWTLEDTGLLKEDRLIEVNGKIVLTKTRDDLIRLLAAGPDPAKLVVLRKVMDDGAHTIGFTRTAAQEVAGLRTELENVKERADEAQRIKDGLKSDNIRLTHRISYLEEQVSELLSNKKPDPETRIMSPPPVISKSNQNVTNINITSQNSPVSTHSSHSGEIQVFQKGPQVTALVAKVPNMEKDVIPTRSKSSLSNVSSTHIPAPSPQPDFHHKMQRHKSRNGIKSPLKESYEELEKVSYRKQHNHREKDYNSETNSNNGEHRSARKNFENRYSADFTRTTSEKDYRNSDLVDQSYKKATKIIQELTRTTKQDPSLYEKHRQRCITASEKYNADILKHYNARKSTSVLDFRSEVHIGPKYSDSRSVEELDVPPESPSKAINKLFKKVQASRSVKSLDFDSDCNSTSTRNGYKSTDYNSEVDNTRKQNHYESNGKHRPTPPKKPLRLSLHKTHSLQSVDSSNIPPEMQNGKGESRKRNYKGQIHLEATDYKEQVMWNCYRRTLDNGVEQGTWC
ncbi:putative autophagy-related protein 11 isoform X1 [Euwallacea fornicatus]|uniref:putative autophagy-related protein 11 isoform X1 n=1 Tax=Euwallacea fornicatus TaxID=995702 RepID=UPI0033901EDE